LFEQIASWQFVTAAGAGDQEEGRGIFTTKV